MFSNSHARKKRSTFRDGMFLKISVTNYSWYNFERPQKETKVGNTVKNFDNSKTYFRFGWAIQETLNHTAKLSSRTSWQTLHISMHAFSDSLDT